MEVQPGNKILKVICQNSAYDPNEDPRRKMKEKPRFKITNKGQVEYVETSKKAENVPEITDYKAKVDEILQMIDAKPLDSFWGK